MFQPTSSYHDSSFSEHLFLGDSRQELEEGARVTSNLLAVLEQDPRPQFADAIRLNRDHLHQTTAALERQYTCIERLETDPVMITELRDHALTLILELPISQYLASIRPGILLWRAGNIFHSPCPFAGHDFDEHSFQIFNDDYAWCGRCGGGNVFHVIGMVEALPSPHQQVRRAAEIAGLDLPDRPRKIVPPIIHIRVWELGNDFQRSRSSRVEWRDEVLRIGYDARSTDGTDVPGEAVSR